MFIFDIGIILGFPTSSLLHEGYMNTATRYDRKNYLNALANQLHLPFLGWKTVWDPENKELWNKYLHLKVKNDVSIII